MTDKPTRPEIHAGEHWFIQLPGETSLTCVRVSKATRRIVSLRWRADNAQFRRTYKIEDVEFVEQVK